MRPEIDRRDLVVALEADPRLDQVGRENASLGEVFVVGLQAVDHRGQLGGRLRDVRGLFRRQLVEVLVDRRRRLDLVLMPSRPAISMAENARYGLPDESGNGTPAALPSGCCR